MLEIHHLNLLLEPVWRCVFGSYLLKVDLCCLYELTLYLAAGWESLDSIGDVRLPCALIQLPVAYTNPSESEKSPVLQNCEPFITTTTAHALSQPGTPAKETLPSSPPVRPCRHRGKGKANP